MLRQVQSQKLLQKLSPQQIQLMKMLQLPTVALEQRIKEELEINPALEEGPADDDVKESADDIENMDDGDDSSEKREDFSFEDYMDDADDASYKYQVKNTGSDDEQREMPLSGGQTFQDVLESQLGLQELNDRDYQIGLYLIGNIDEDGYLRRDLNSVVDDLAFSQNISCTVQELESVLKVIQQLDPAGVGARDLQECLLLQLRRKEPKSWMLDQAIEIVTHHMDEFSKKHYDKIAKKLDLDEEALKEIIGEIIHLNPKPGNSMSDGQKNIQEITPDFTITTNDGIVELSLNQRNAPELKISKEYVEMLEQYSKNKDKQSKEAAMFVKQKIEGARWFIDAIMQRQQTLILTMQAIVDYQKEYFLEGDETKLKPMILKDIAEKVHLDISTVSRVANSKYVQTPFGTFLLKTFFSESLSTDGGEEVSTREVKRILKDCIEAEDKSKPITDDKLCQILKDKGYNIARRTVAKYREQLDIPVARMRKQL